MNLVQTLSTRKMHMCLYSSSSSKQLTALQLVTVEGP